MNVLSLLFVQWLPPFLHSAVVVELNMVYELGNWLSAPNSEQKWQQ